ncbi:DMT family transporter [Conservatibacter flavescens]|uniref:EamA-like transporter family protein n=1 Tax=Conservatibacter flavescens TaxID=28161 RepID=A0A2M8S1V4_9PAST|nr:DMT family transporter [Conservatibacter flavescens]PJG85107.1 hypothetical protein CVP05_07570 [Conservatibacter flavescens]
MTISFLLIAFCAGIAMAVQAAINTQLSNAMVGQPIVAALISFATGAVVLFLVCLWKADLVEAINNLPKQPLWKFIGGPLGALVVFTSIFLAPKIGVTNMLFFIIIGQLVTAMLIDHFGLIGMPVRTMDIWKILGLIVILIGLGLFFFGKQFFSEG